MADAVASEQTQPSSGAPAEVPVVDPLCAASSLLLRDVHLALLRFVEGTGSSRPKKPSAPPDAARLQLDELLHHRAPVAAQSHWSQRVSACLLNAGVAAVGEEAFVSGWWQSVWLDTSRMDSAARFVTFGALDVQLIPCMPTSLTCQIVVMSCATKHVAQMTNASQHPKHNLHVFQKISASLQSNLSSAVPC